MIKQKKTTFLVAAPHPGHLAVDLGRGRRPEISTAGTGFVQSLTVNGHAWNKSWVKWDDVFGNGGRMHFALGPEKTRWDTGERPLWGLV